VLTAFGLNKVLLSLKKFSCSVYSASPYKSSSTSSWFPD